ncbi:MAG: alpha/beta hydrolase [Lachnospiraceae bacterium]|nr:alpha/beta hydrolase [Lachnospiraceae bacterium]
MIKAAAYHKNLAQTYALMANCAVLFVDYRLAPEYKFPIPVKDCYRAYLWALKNLSFDKMVIGGDSAGADLAMSVMLLAKKKQMRMPDGQMLIYPGCAGNPATESMRRYTDTPLWNSKLNRRALALYGDEKNYQNSLFRPILAVSFSRFPKAYVETAEFDCLHDAGVQIAERYGKDGVPVIWNDTKRTMHGYDIVEKSPYVRKQVDKRICFLREVFKEADRG